ncbi:MAG: hypothetical protein P8Y53_17005 [Pseudolabrys sp.]|nr:hypothetical protein [Gammaproteobacteria bacterium]
MIENLASYRLGETEGDIILESSEDCREVALALARQAHRSLHIFGQELDPAVYDSSEFNQAVRDVAIAHPSNQIKVLVHDADSVIKRGHRLIELARRVTSHIEIRKLTEDYAHYNEAYLIADGRGLLYRKHAGRYDGIAAFNDPMRARELVRFFEEAWQRSQQFREFRRLQV